ncbi:helix-turn-helix domain-containing protein [Shewanella nanhaiensis]|uniref:Helix-turn-helix domain-containing protein n=1 Tax=Shewanella nanhaiensis TaxID=2864872 RepID=A0ABS7E4W6_9GAMM|nr:helix-turn-helix domain-containing protein [Shewanella nanhaiensis]MBW8184728.1 helix-turn-helix domain-containing protein [Shewanella nanhaiensis]
MADNICEPEDLMKLVRKETNARMRLKLLALLHFQEGKSRYQIADYLKVSRTSVNKWITSYLSSGLEGLKDKKHTGRPSALNEEQMLELSQFIKRRIATRSTKPLHGCDVQQFIAEKFGVNYEISNIYRILERLGYAWVTHADNQKYVDHI